ncbi:DUF4852 domain-containing protein [Mesorhizobium sp. 1B3]|uniref:DUF4852 domain-containing protein n=1 Tax=Mesorhizobium sp. 1B3 TaxID=3243599 RepID=UPI003D96C375
MAADFTYDSVLPVYLKLDSTLMPEDIVDGYMETYRPEVWSKFRNDEFELEEKREETLRMMKDRIAAADASETFIIQSRFEFGDYDFKNEKFDFRPFADGLFFKLDHCCTDLPRKIKVSFLNADLVDGIQMAKDEAKAFLNSRKSSGGYVNRTVLAKLSIVMKEVPARGDLKSEIQSVEIYDNDGRTLITKIARESATN